MQLDANTIIEDIEWTVVDGALPADITLSASGLLSGTPSVDGVSTFQVRASSPSYPELSAETFDVQVSDGTLNLRFTTTGSSHWKIQGVEVVPAPSF